MILYETYTCPKKKQSYQVQDSIAIYLKMVLKFHHSVITLRSYFHFTSLKIEYAIVLTVLMEELRTDHIAKEWGLFIDSSKASLKGVLLHNGNKKLSLPSIGNERNI